MLKTLYCLALFLTSMALYGQVGIKSSIYTGQNQSRSFVVKKIDNVIIPDGILNEPVWETANSAENFWQYFPLDSVQAKQQTEIKMLYDDKNLYIGIVVYALGRDYAIQSLKRDYRAGNSDNISLIFDTFSDSNNAFLFGINPYGVRREGLVSGGGQDFRSFTTTWDVKWKGDSKIYETYYTSEMVIPLSSFKFKEGETKWRFNSYRFDKQSNETSTWVNIPQNQNVWGLAFMGEMIFEKPLGKSKTPLALIPYINGSALKDFEEDNTTNKLSVGGDAKVAIGSSMNLDITINPDFSQVEVDDQVTNLTRFEISLPEKRQFFIDNNDLFGSFGDQRDANPFFSRRIGIAKDTAGNTIENRIIGGIRLSGKVNKDLRLGFLNLQTAADEENEIPSNNNMMLALQQKVFSRSNIGFFFINRQSLRDYDFILPEDEYNRVLGIEYNLISKDNVWNGKYFFQKSFQPESNGTDLATGARLEYNSRNYNISGKLIYIDEDFRSDLGFVRRTDILKNFVRLERVFWPKNRFIQNHAFQFLPIFIWSPSMDLKNTDYDFRGQWEARFRDQSRFNVEFSNKYTFLIDDFDPTGTDGGIPLPGNRGYHYNSVKAEYNSDRRKIFAYSLEPSIGQFFNGNRFSVQGGMTFRFQPKVFLSMIMRYDNIELPDPYPSAEIWLISPKIEVTFTKSIFWSTLIQYSNQRDNFGINSRLQWRFAPLSDLFLVYNDNYFVDGFAPKTRSINLKVTYWLNI
ncbi:MAG: carbohydrate binding family 9 domain-containing protein [Flavobacteriaceae bacterium]|nr:MAG: carbohydrate binding family 9 domain-containing protein [Flavobacteriaceae bacterium]